MNSKSEFQLKFPLQKLKNINISRNKESIVELLSQEDKDDIKLEFETRLREKALNCPFVFEVTNSKKR